MATIETYETASGAKRYMVRYRTPNRTQTKKRGFTTRRDAKEFANTVEVEKLSGTYVAPSAGRVTIGDLGPGWLQRQAGHTAQSSQRSRESAWRVHVQPRWATTQVVDIAATDVQAWIAQLSTDPKTGRRKGVGLKAEVIETCLTVLSGVLDDAVTDRRIAANPLRNKLKLPRRVEKPHKYLTHDQVRALAAEAKHSEIVLLLAYTGLRWGELAGMRVRHLDLLRRRIGLVDNAVTVGSRIVVGTLKGHRHRTVSMPGFVAEALARLCEGKSRDALLWADRSGQPVKPPASKDSWLSGAVQRCMKADPTFPRVTAHSLRHTYASLAVSAGANVKVIQRQLGHRSAAITLDVYADLFDTDLDAVAQAFDEKCAQNVPKLAELRVLPDAK
jgi:integrase